MLLGFKTELNINNVQRTLLAKHAGTARHAYNQGLRLTQQVLDWNKANLEDKIKFPSAIDLHKWLVASVKSENPWYYDVAKSTPQQALRYLREAWDRFFKKMAKPPAFKKKGVNDSFALEGNGLRFLGSNHIRVPKIGVLKTFEDLPTGLEVVN